VTSPPGWHPDPRPAEPGQPPLLRYWDGAQWTEHTSGVPVPQPYHRGKPATTPDGAPLAGWWHRICAYSIDAVILIVLSGILAAPWWREVFDVYRDFFDEVMADAAAGRQSTTSSFDLQRQVIGPMAIITLISTSVSAVYNVGFLSWKQATPGKLLTGLRVRLRERPGAMPIGTLLLRWVGQFGYGVLTLIPFVGGAIGLYGLLDGLWPLWDYNKQALHDKIAKTNVVRVR
jgi:uncharacterized RDD family membrane protein YckC